MFCCLSVHSDENSKSSSQADHLKHTQPEASVCTHLHPSLHLSDKNPSVFADSSPAACWSQTFGGTNERKRLFPCGAVTSLSVVPADGLLSACSSAERHPSSDSFIVLTRSTQTYRASTRPRSPSTSSQRCSGSGFSTFTPKKVNFEQI